MFRPCTIEGMMLKHFKFIHYSIQNSSYEKIIILDNAIVTFLKD